MRRTGPVHALLAVVLAALALGAAPSTAISPAQASSGDVIGAVSGSTPSIRIHDIQGTGHISPLAGQRVFDVPGLVTARRSNGFYLEDPEPDADDRTSEGIFVFTSSRAKPEVGDGVTVSGTVSEFRPGCPPSSCTASSSGFANLTVTEIISPIWKSLSGLGPLPPPIVIGVDGRAPRTSTMDGNDGPNGNVEDGGTFSPATDGVDFYESLEGMRVVIHNPIAVGLRSSGAVPVLADLGAGASVRTPRGGVVLREDDANPERIILAGGITPTRNVNVGDVMYGEVTGIVDYTAGNFTVVVTSVPAITSGGLTREAAFEPPAGQLSIATFNLENLDPSDGPARFNGLASEIVNNLRSPDLIAVEEVQDNNGPVNDSLVDASLTFTMLTDAIATAGGPSYDFRDIAPVDGEDGGEPGGNIRVGFLFRSDRSLSFVDRAGGGPTDEVAVEPGPRLSFSPGRIKPDDEAFSQSRKPLAGEFLYDGHPLFVVAVHLISRIGDDPLFGRFQPPRLGTGVKRAEQAQIVHDFVSGLLATDPGARIVVLGDFNDFQFGPALLTVAGSELRNLTGTLAESERYSYIHEGNSQAIDHILVSQRLFAELVEYDIVHVNAELIDQVSDHDPARALFAIAS